MKTCITCGIEKDLSCFAIKSNKCRDCKREYDKEYYQKNKEEIKEYDKQYRENNLDKIKQYLSDNKEQIAEKSKQYRLENIEWFLEYDKQYRATHKEEKKEYNKQWRLENKEQRKEYDKQYTATHKNEAAKKRRKTDPSFRLRKNISCAVGAALKRQGSSKGGSVLNYLPFTIQELIVHLERQFEPWMNWNNQGIYVEAEWDDADPSTWKWQLDHRIAQSKLPFSSMKDDNFKKCWALDNLRPYSAKQNVIDGDRR